MSANNEVYDYSFLRTSPDTSSNDKGRMVVTAKCVKCDPPFSIKASGMTRTQAVQGARKLYRIHVSRSHLELRNDNA